MIFIDFLKKNRGVKKSRKWSTSLQKRHKLLRNLTLASNSFILPTREKIAFGYFLYLPITHRTGCFSHPGAKMWVDSPVDVCVPPLAYDYGSDGVTKIAKEKATNLREGKPRKWVGKDSNLSKRICHEVEKVFCWWFFGFGVGLLTRKMFAGAVVCPEVGKWVGEGRVVGIERNKKR